MQGGLGQALPGKNLLVIANFNVIEFDGHPHDRYALWCIYVSVFGLRLSSYPELMKTISRAKATDHAAKMALTRPQVQAACARPDDDITPSSRARKRRGKRRNQDSRLSSGPMVSCRDHHTRRVQAWKQIGRNLSVSRRSSIQLTEIRARRRSGQDPPR